MATLGRSLKSPTYLSRASKRPAMSARAFSNSSEVSVASADSRPDDYFELPTGVMSGINTPAQEMTESDSLDTGRRKTHQNPFAPELAGPVPRLNSPSFHSPRSSPSHPIAIELPNFHVATSGPNCTPPEPLSARGDVLGGYFPRHEDPTARVHRPHPFRPDPAHHRNHSPSSKRLPAIQVSNAPEATPAGHPPNPSWPSTQSEPAHLHIMSDQRAMRSPDTPVASWVPLGAVDNPLPVGKYYPSNYERTHQSPPSSCPKDSISRSQFRPSPAIAPSSVQSDSQLLAQPTDRSSVHDSDAKRKLQQYQRDMVAQAQLAANQVLGGGSRISTTLSSAGTLHGVSMASLRHLAGPGSQKPLSPRLLPLGSPGPVTPMDLEGGPQAGGSGGYLDLRRAPSAYSTENEQLAWALRAEETLIGKDGHGSPAIEASTRLHI